MPHKASRPHLLRAKQPLNRNKTKAVTKILKILQIISLKLQIIVSKELQHLNTKILYLLIRLNNNSNNNNNKHK